MSEETIAKTPMVASSTMTGWFNPEFDQQMGQDLTHAVQEAIGCFECGNPEPTKTCSRCKLAKYCSQDCQKKDWKKSHKELCQIYLDNKEPHGPMPGAPVPILLRSVGLIGEPDFETAMKNRRVLFLEGAAKSKERPVSMSFSCAIVPMFRKLRLVIAPSFFDHREVHQVPHLVLDAVDGDAAAIDRWDSYGKISNAAMDRVVESWVEFYVEMEGANIHPLAITCGIGLHERVDELEEKLKKKGVSGMGFIASAHLLMD